MKKPPFPRSKWLC